MQEKNNFEMAVSGALIEFPALNPSYYRAGEMEQLPKALRDLPERFKIYLEKLPALSREINGLPPTDIYQKQLDRAWIVGLAGGELKEDIFPVLHDTPRTQRGLFEDAAEAENLIAVKRGSDCISCSGQRIGLIHARSLLNHYNMVANGIGV